MLSHLIEREDAEIQRGRKTTNDRVRCRQTDNTWVPFGSSEATTFLYSDTEVTGCWFTSSITSPARSSPASPSTFVTSTLRIRFGKSSRFTTSGVTSATSTDPSALASSGSFWG